MFSEMLKMLMLRDYCKTVTVTVISQKKGFESSPLVWSLSNESLNDPSNKETGFKVSKVKLNLISCTRGAFNSATHKWVTEKKAPCGALTGGLYTLQKGCLKLPSIVLQTHVIAQFPTICSNP